MTIDFNIGDDLSDLLGDTAQAAPKALPQDEQLTRIRQSGIGHTPVAPAFKVPCRKCGGSGVWHGGRSSGPCFTCKGKGSFERKTSPVALAANRAKAAERKVNSAKMNWAAFVVTFPAEAEVLIKGIAQTFGDGRWNSICAEIKGKVEKYGDLHEGTMAMLGRAVARAAERAVQKAAQNVAVEAVTPAAGFPNLRAAFDAVVARGAKKAQMTFGSFNVSLASLGGRNPGALYVKWNGEYAGKIVGTKFFGRNAIPEMVAAMAIVEADPQGAIKAEADKTAKRIADAEARGEKIEIPCGCCGILLDNPISRARGIGPICAGKWGF